MTIPGKNFKIRVGPFFYEVYLTNQDVIDGEEVYGSTHNSDQKIFLDGRRTRQKVEQTFIHELLHACCFVNGLSYRFNGEKKVDEEDVCREMSMTLYQVIRDNPNIFNFQEGGEKNVKKTQKKS